MMSERRGVLARRWPRRRCAALGAALEPGRSRGSPRGFSFANVAREAGPARRHRLRRPARRTLPAGDDRLRRRLLRLRRRRLARRLPGQRHDARRLPARPGADQPPLPQPRRRHVRGRHRAQAGLAASGWGQGACAGDYDNDGHEDLFVTYYGQNRLYPQPRRRHVRGRRPRAAGSGAHAHALGHRLRVPRLRPRRPPRPVRRQLHRPRPGHGAHARLRPLPLQGRQGGLRPARAFPGARTRSTATRATAPSRTSRSRPASRAPAAPTAWA